MKNIFKRTLAVFLVVFALVSVFAISASASEFYSKSTMTMVDPNTHKTASTFYLYGRADYICLKMNNDKHGQGSDFPTFELYSDSKYKKMIAYYQQGDPSDKTAYITLSLDLSNIKSGTYYAKTYIEKLNSYTQVKDESTEKTYKIVIKKGGTKMTDMNTVMYGYENTENGPKIYWFGVPDTTGYYVYRRNPDTKKYEKIKTVKDNDKKLVSYTDGARKNKNSTDYYKVVAYKGSKKTPQSLKSLKATVLKTPVITIEPKPWKSITVKWSKVKKGAEYIVLMRTKNSDWEECVTTTSTGMTMCFDGDEYQSNDVYYFTVIANVKGVYSGYNTKGKAFRYLDAPELKPCTYPDEGGITVNWDLVKGADQYAIYKKSGKKWNEIALVAGDQTSYTDLTVESAQGATYTVCSVANGAYKYYDTYGVKGIKFEKMILNDVVETDGKLQISWTNPVEAQSCSYEVYYKENGSKYKYFTRTSDTNCLFTPSRDIVTYEFNVHATKDDAVGPDNETGAIYTYYPKMYSPTVLGSASGAKLSWSGFNKAESYILYKKTADGEYEFLTETTEKTFVDTNVENDVSYSYKLAYKHNDTVMNEYESSETTVTFIDEVVELASDYITPEYRRYWVPIKDYESENCTYRLYEKNNGIWKVNYDGYVNSSGEMKIEGDSGIREFAIIKTYSDGRVTKLPDNGFIIDFEGCAKKVAFSKNENVATFTWDPETFGAEKVVIYKNDELLGTADKDAGVFTDSDMQPNVNTHYRILTQSGSFVSYKSVEKEAAYLVTPDFKISSGNGRVDIYWDEIEADCRVIVYRAKGTSTKFTEIESCFPDHKGTEDYHVGSGYTYRYAIALRDSEGNTTPYKDNVKTIRYLDTPVITSAKTNKDGVKISWREVKKTKGYILSYKKDGKWVTLADLPADKTSYTDKTVESGKKRIYMVYAYSGDYKSAQSTKTTYFLSRPSITSISSTTKQMKINFKAVEGATKYKIYYKVDNLDEWHVVATTKSTSYTYKTKRPGVKFTFAVSAVLEKGSKDYVSYKSASKTAKNLATPTLDTIKSTKSGMQLTWNVTPYATGYNVYRKNSDGEFEKIAYVKGNETVSYTDKTAKKGKTYTYTVGATYGDCVSSYNKTGLKCKDKY